jgi:two-component system phosphate regulon sensor histidine kinase PhoR
MVQLREDAFLRLIGGFRLPEGWEDLRLMPLADTAGGIVIESGFPLVIDDVAGDRRLPARALARQMGVGSYAGFPVRDPAGEVVGVCCVADDRPRRWQPAELAAVDHAAQACTAFVAEQESRREADRHRRFLDAVLQNLRSAWRRATRPDGSGWPSARRSWRGTAGRSPSCPTTRRAPG